MADKSQDSSKQRFKNGENKKNKKQFGSSHFLKKRKPPTEFRGPNDIYITNSSNFKVLIWYCHNQTCCEIYFHNILVF